MWQSDKNGIGKIEEMKKNQIIYYKLEEYMIW